MGQATSMDQHTHLRPTERVLLLLPLAASAYVGLLQFFLPQLLAQTTGYSGNDPYVYQLSGTATFGYASEHHMSAFVPMYGQLSEQRGEPCPRLLSRAESDSYLTIIAHISRLEKILYYNTPTRGELIIGNALNSSSSFSSAHASQ